MKIKLFAMDVDGTMTDGRFTVDSFGNETKTFNVKDGMAVNILKSKNVITAILTNHKSAIVKNRAKQLGIDYYYDDASNKLQILNSLVKNLGISLEDVAYIGDDLNDYEVMINVGVPACPKDAAKEIKTICSFVSELKGGHGCIRDFVEELIKWERL